MSARALSVLVHATLGELSKSHLRKSQQYHVSITDTVRVNIVSDLTVPPTPVPFPPTAILYDTGETLTADPHEGVLNSGDNVIHLDGWIRGIGADKEKIVIGLSSLCIKDFGPELRRVEPPMKLVVIDRASFKLEKTVYFSDCGQIHDLTLVSDVDCTRKGNALRPLDPPPLKAPRGVRYPSLTAALAPVTEEQGVRGAERGLLLYDGSADSLRDNLEKSFYGDTTGNELAFNDGSLLFTPTSPKDHVMTCFIQLPVVPKGEVRTLLVDLQFKNGLPKPGLNVELQNSDFATVAPVGRFATADDGDSPSLRSIFTFQGISSNAVRLVFSTKEGGRVALPSRIVIGC